MTKSQNAEYNYDLGWIINGNCNQINKFIIYCKSRNIPFIWANKEKRRSVFKIEIIMQMIDYKINHNGLLLLDKLFKEELICLNGFNDYTHRYSLKTESVLLFSTEFNLLYNLKEIVKIIQENKTVVYKS